MIFVLLINAMSSKKHLLDFQIFTGLEINTEIIQELMNFLVDQKMEDSLE
jgi:hypothetical protein